VLSIVFRFIASVVLLTFLPICLAAPATAEAPAESASVVFLNPGHSNEPFWVTYSQFMHAAAKNLDVNLHVIYGERKREDILQSALALANSPHPPDYVIFVNEMYVGPEILRIFAETPVKLFSLHSTLTAEQQLLSGGTRENYKNWIGSLVANDEEAGYLMAKALIANLDSKPSNMLAFAGVRSTPSSTLREEGLYRALKEHPEIRLQQLVYGEWSRQRAYEQAKLLLKRYASTPLLWAANDEMAFGVINAAQELGKTPGKDIFLSALNNSDEVLHARLEGQIAALVGGHFSLGGWAIVMLHDHHAGLDFAARGGKDRIDNLFTLLNSQQAARLRQHLKKPGAEMNFKDFSAVYHPEMKEYEFTIKALLR
jgi:ABC-type sugar transport system substrate-binding protein